MVTLRPRLLMSTKSEYAAEIQPICLAQPSTINLTPGDMLTVTGWGKLVDGTFTGPSIYLYTADIPYADNSVCSDVYGDIMIESTLCCSSINGTSTCNVSGYRHYYFLKN